jgi:hypothetical protein
MLKSITIFGVDLDVIMSDTTENHGEFNIDDRTIVLDSTQSHQELWSTLFHECCHAALRIGGVAYMLTEQQEEAVVRAIEGGIWPAVREVFSQAVSEETPPARRNRKKRSIVARGLPTSGGSLEQSTTKGRQRAT